MSSLPKPEPEPPFMSRDELVALRGTPAFEAEYRRQQEFVSKHYRRTNFAGFIEPDDEDLLGWS